MNDNTSKTPVHLWIVGILALLWNAVDAFDFLATQIKLGACPRIEAVARGSHIESIFLVL